MRERGREREGKRERERERDYLITDPPAPKKSLFWLSHGAGGLSLDLRG